MKEKNINDLKKDLQLTPLDSGVWAELAVKLEEVGQIEDALGAWRKAGENGFNQEDALAEELRLLMDLGRYSEALKVADKAESSGYADEKLLIFRSRIAAGQENLVKSKKLLQKAVKIPHLKNEATFELGLLKERMGETQAASKFFSLALKSGYRPAESARQLAVIYRSRGKVDEANKVLAPYALEPGASPEIMSEYARICAEHKKYKDAAKFFKRAAENTEDQLSGRNYFDWALIEEIEGDDKASLKAFRSALRKGYRTPESIRRLARSYRKNNDPEKALKLLVPEISDDVDLEMRAEYARALAAKGDTLGASEQFKKVLASTGEKESIEYSFEAGTILKDAGDYLNAISFFEETLNKDPLRQGVREHLGRVYIETGNYRDAERIFRTLVESKERDSSAYLALAAVLRTNRKTQEAIGFLKEGISLFQKEHALYLELGKFLEEEKLYIAAAEVFEKLQKLLKEAGLSLLPAQKHLARIYAEESRWDKVEELLKKMVASDLKGEDYAYLSRIYSLMQKDYEADAAAERAVELGGGEIYTFMRAAESRLRKGDEESSLRFLEEAAKKGSSDIHHKNKILVQKEVLEGSLNLEAMPQSLSVHLTNRCNLRCVMCHHHKVKNWDLPERVADDIIEMLPYLESLSWLGGEVFLYKDFEKLFTEGQKHLGIHQELVTNGLLIDKSWAARLAESNLELEFSIDSIAPENYAKIRRGGDLLKVKKNIEMINKARHKLKEQSRLKTSMHFVVMKTNYKEIPKLADFASSMGMSVLKLYLISGDYEGYNILPEDREILAFIRDALVELREKAWKKNLSFHNMMNIMLPEGDPGLVDETEVGDLES
ncbi:MAG: tetratricopeptide repeat protein [Elusimicrobia bacterium]|nr:tetratricopeptide repeat protein [Elusimicrobiota bacterium]